MKILSIGNSFSKDAQRYLHALAKQDGVDIKAVNLFISGCPLRKHYLNMLDDCAHYDFELNGEATGIKVSIRQALVSDNWDVVTLQQASPISGRWETYSPYLEELAAYVRHYCPHAKIFMHQTWAYEDGSEKLQALSLFATAKEMLAAVCDAYDLAAQKISADGIIPCGKAMMAATELGVGRVHRDTYHAALGVGRYLLALCWYKTLTGRDISANSFDALDAPMTALERELAIRAVNSVTV